MATPCGWNVAVENCDAYESLSAEKQDMVIDMAVDFLWNWTGRNFGACTLSVRPCRAHCLDQSSTFWGRGSTLSGSSAFVPYLWNGQWFNLACGRCGDNCGCTYTPAIRLPGPVQSIVQVLEDGLVVPDTSYRVDNEKWLVRTDGNDWPTCQNMVLDPTTDPGTFEVTYVAGVEVPAGGLVAASLLACEFAKSIVAPSDCQLPKRIQNITRQGVTVTLFNNFDDLEKGGTGIWMIDSWVASVMKAPRASTVLSPDIPRPRMRRTTWSAP